MRNVVRAGATGIALATVLLSNPATAQAADPLQRVSGAGCASAGNNTFRCFDNFAGGIAPYTATATTSNNYSSISRITLSGDSAGFEVVVYGYCTSGKGVTVTLTVSDSSGQTVTSIRNSTCGSISEI
jgi:hypothetical protein